MSNRKFTAKVIEPTVLQDVSYDTYLPATNYAQMVPTSEYEPVKPVQNSASWIHPTDNYDALAAQKQQQEVLQQQEVVEAARQQAPQQAIIYNEDYILREVARRKAEHFTLASAQAEIERRLALEIASYTSSYVMPTPATYQMPKPAPVPVSSRIEYEPMPVTKTKTKRSRHASKLEKQAKMYIPAGHQLIATKFGYYTVPMYCDMTYDEQQEKFNTFTALFRSLNHHWKDKGLTFELPKIGESLTNIDLRYQQALKYIKQQSGCNMPKLIMMACWIGIEVIAKKMGMNAEGYFMAQVNMYDVYHSKLVQMGEIGGFGEDWPAWVYLVVVSCANLAMIVGLNLYAPKNIDKGQLMAGLTGFFSGKTTTTSEVDGVIAPSADPLSDALGGMKMPGGANLTTMAGSLMGFFNKAQGGGSTTAAATKSKTVDKTAAVKKPRKRADPL
jgi:hypothetical protein